MLGVHIGTVHGAHGWPPKNCQQYSIIVCYDNAAWTIIAIHFAQIDGEPRPNAMCVCIISACTMHNRASSGLAGDCGVSSQQLEPIEYLVNDLRHTKCHSASILRVHGICLRWNVGGNLAIASRMVVVCARARCRKILLLEMWPHKTKNVSPASCHSATMYDICGVRARQLIVCKTGRTSDTLSVCIQNVYEPREWAGERNT